MAKQQIRSDKLRQPSGVFSHATMIEATGRLVFISGMTARDEQGEKVGKDDPEAQAVQVYENIKTCVQAAVGGKPRLYEGDHLKGDHSTDWTIPAGGEIRTYEHLVHITLSSHFTAHKMPRAEYTKLLDALDGCSKKK